VFTKQFSTIYVYEHYTKLINAALETTADKTFCQVVTDLKIIADAHIGLFAASLYLRLRQLPVVSNWATHSLSW